MQRENDSAIFGKLIRESVQMLTIFGTECLDINLTDSAAFKEKDLLVLHVNGNTSAADTAANPAPKTSDSPCLPQHLSIFSIEARQ